MAPCLQRSAGEDDKAALARAALQIRASLLLHREMGGSLQVAQWLCEQSLQTYREKLGGKHPNTLTSINNLGLLLKDQGDLPGADSLYREALNTNRETLGDKHPSTLTSIN